MRFLLAALAIAVAAVAGATDNLVWGIPGPADQIVDRQGYAIGFSRAHLQPLWVSYRLTADELTNRVARRGFLFAGDPDIRGGSSLPSDYLRSGFDRGHLAPAADMAWETNVMAESFLMSNMSPQRPEFNRGVWKRLEREVRGIARRIGAVAVVTGPVFLPDITNRAAIGIGRVSVPEGYYKALLDERPPRKAIAFYLPNCGSDAPPESFAVSVDEIERITGLDLFSALEDDEEACVESACPEPAAWGVGSP